MARLFDNNTANYMSRASVDLGLNGLTACSYACWVKITASDPTNEQRIFQKEINGLDGWNSLKCSLVVNTTKIGFEVNNQSLTQYPHWDVSSGLSTGVWTRALFTWGRTAGAASTDAAVYINGQAVATTFTANGYTNTFTIQENSSNLYYGIRAITLTQPYNGALAWVCVWNRQLTAQEALIDYTNPRNVTSGLISRVPIGDSDKDEALGGSMTINGTLRNVTGNEPIWGATPSFLQMSSHNFYGG